MDVVTGVASCVVEKILEYPVRLIGRHLGYLIYYKTNKKNLTDREPELDDKISSVQRRAQAARRNGEELEECVTRWISEAERKDQEAKDVIDDPGHENAKCSCNGSFPNLVSRYKLSKKAKLMAEDIVDHIGKPDKFGNFAYRLRLQPSFKNKDFVVFGFLMIGVYGMGGIGKTTLVTEVARQAKEEDCFSELVMVTVSQDFDVKSIQKGIAEGLGLKLDEEDMSARANRLKHRLRQGNKILIILDDIWDELDLSKDGISFNADDQKGCKILLVSRVRDVLCNTMGVTKITEVKVLSDSEAKGFFDKFVGDIDDNSEVKGLANQVVGECGGLPIAIVTIACSLKNKEIFVWKDILSRLKSSRGMEEKVRSSIKMSYDVLEREEKKLLLLCCLHGEYANVRVNELMFYGIGLHLFQGVHTIEEARCRAHSLVDKLKAHCLLLDGDYEGTVLVALDLSRSTFSQLPEHIGRLTQLRSLSLSDCTDLKVIQPNAISSLVRLEELYMDEVYIDWEVEGRVGEGRNASLVEFKNLRNLTTLHLNVRDANVLPKDMFSENLKCYRIMIGSFSNYADFTGSRLLSLDLRESSQLYYEYGIQKLMKNSEVMWLRGFHGIDNIVYELDTYSFQQLRELEVSSCPNLKYLFTVAMAGKLAQLETLKICGCPVMEEVLFTKEPIEEGTPQKISFPKLKNLELENLQNIRRFCAGCCIEFPSLTNMIIGRNPAMRAEILQ